VYRRLGRKRRVRQTSGCFWTTNSHVNKCGGQANQLTAGKLDTAEDGAATGSSGAASKMTYPSFIYLRRTLHTLYSSRSRTRLVPAASRLKLLGEGLGSKSHTLHSITHLDLLLLFVFFVVVLLFCLAVLLLAYTCEICLGLGCHLRVIRVYFTKKIKAPAFNLFKSKLPTNYCIVTSIIAHENTAIKYAIMQFTLLLFQWALKYVTR